MDKHKISFTRIRLLVGITFASIYLIVSKPSLLVLYVIGAELAIFGEVIRIWSTGYIRKNKLLCSAGPYGYLRHPLYLGSFFIGLGFCVIAINPQVIVNTIIIFVLFFSLFIFIYNTAIKKEEENLIKTFGNEYVRYKEVVPSIIPRLRPYYEDNLVRFSWSLFLKNKEYNAVIGVCILLIIAYIKLMME